MKSTVFTAAFIGLLAIPAGTAAQTDFTGTWVLDASRSQGLPEGLEQIMTVTQAVDRIEVETQTTTPIGVQRNPDVYVLDGRESDFQPTVVGGSSSGGKRTSRWSEGRTGFEATEQATLQGPDGEMTLTASRRWMLAPGGDLLTIEVSINGPQGETKSTRVFTRQKPTAG